MDARTTISPGSLEPAPTGPVHHTRQGLLPSCYSCLTWGAPWAVKAEVPMTSTRRVSRTHKGEAEFLLSCKYRRSCEENLLLEYYNWFLPSIMSTGFRLRDWHLHLLAFSLAQKSLRQDSRRLVTSATCFSFKIEANFCRAKNEGYSVFILVCERQSQVSG